MTKFVLISISSPHLNIVKSVLSMNPKHKVSSIYDFLVKRQQIKREGNCSSKDFEYFKTEIYAWDDKKTTPIVFQRVAVDPNVKLGKIKDSPILMVKRQYFDEKMDDNTLLTKNNAKLAVIKEFDESFVRPPTPTNITEWFDCRYVDRRPEHSHGSVGVDADYLYLVERKTVDSDLETAKRGVEVRLVNPRLSMSLIANYSLLQDRLVIQTTVPQSQIVIESESARQIFSKIDYILARAREKNGPAPTTAF